MEIKEAIADLKEMALAFGYGSHKSEKLEDSPYGEAVNMAISALEKHDGKKPINRRCPNCGSDDIEVWQDGGYVTTKFNFCPDCGQKIDWTEVDDGN